MLLTYHSTLREKAALKDNWEPRFENVPRGSKLFKIGDVTVDTGDLEMVDDIFTAGAKVSVNGVKKAPGKFVYKSKANPSVRVVLDDTMDLVKANMKSNGSEFDLVPFEGRTFVEINADQDIDVGKLNDVEMVSTFHIKSNTYLLWLFANTYALGDREM